MAYIKGESIIELHSGTCYVHSKASVIHVSSEIFQKQKLTKSSTEEHKILLNFVSLNNGKQ
jgi:hypothetical protein